MYIRKETLASAEENLALDEALVEVADRCSHDDPFEAKSIARGEGCNELLRLWELPSRCVVLGRASRWDEEVNSIRCKQDAVPVLRRASGGASIVAGPGCLMYSVLISYEHRPSWRGLDVAHQQVMSRIRVSVQNAANVFELPIQVAVQGTCDLTIDGRKFSGNALRCKRSWMLYHGTIMIAMPLEWLSMYLLEPPRQPAYREMRSHETFVTNVLEGSYPSDTRSFILELEHQLCLAWNATEAWDTYTWKSDVETEAKRLMHDRYANPLWHQSR